MSKSPMPVGKRFGKRVILHEVYRKTGNNARYALCRCDCGTESVVVLGRLKCGGSKSCGCAGKGMIRPKKIRNDPF